MAWLCAINIRVFSCQIAFKRAKQRLPIYGYRDEILEKLKANNIVVLVGLTGSGKSTTLYSCLTSLNHEDVNIMTIEDPVENVIDGVNQSQIFPDIGYTFAGALRTALRQDPDIIMVGEIRDHDTANMAIQAALTGHLVLSTLHTNDAPSSLTRLHDLGVQPFLTELLHFALP